MAKKQSKTNNASKEAESNAAAGKAGTAAANSASADNADTTATSGAEHGSKTAQQSNIDISNVVKRLLETYAAAPEGLDKLVKAEGRHTQVLSDVDKRITAINLSISPGRDAIAKGEAPDLTSFQVEQLRHERTQLQALRRKLRKSNRIISKSFIKKSSNERKTIKLDVLRDKVREPYYHIRYGKFIVPSFENWLGLPMTRDLHDKLVHVRSIRTADYTDALAKMLLMENQALYIKSTSNKELKAGYFAAFRRALAHWQPRTAIIKE